MRDGIDVSKLVARIKKKQKTIDKNSKNLKRAPKYIFAGWGPESGSYPEQKGKPVEEIAEIHEWGLGAHSEKAMVRKTELEHSEKWEDLYMYLVTKAIKAGRNPNYYTIATKVGNQMRIDLRKHLFDINLIDTTRLANTIITKYRRNK